MKKKEKLAHALLDTIILKAATEGHEVKKENSQGGATLISTVLEFKDKKLGIVEWEKEIYVEVYNTYDHNNEGNTHKNYELTEIEAAIVDFLN